ncbi:MAG: hypothetical protein ACKO3P_11300, partial [Planctomycetaceae bacterium]
WWHRMAEKEKMTGVYAWKFWKQPGGVLEVPTDDLPDNPEANDHVFSAGKWWKVIKSLPLWKIHFNPLWAHF